MKPRPAQMIITRYARSRLYDAANGRYVSVQELKQWFAKGVPLIVQDAETDADVTKDRLA